MNTKCLQIKVVFKERVKQHRKKIALSYLNKNNLIKNGI